MMLARQMRSPLCTAATVLMLLVQLQPSESSRASDRLTEQLNILADIRHMPKGTADAEGFINYERSYARTNRHTGSHTSLEYKVSGTPCRRGPNLEERTLVFSRSDPQ